MESVVQSQNRREQELYKQLHEIEATTNTSMKTLRHHESELECSREREEGLKAELETARHRVKRLEENIEAERAAHLVSKLNWEISQNMQSDLREVNMELRHLRSKYADKESQIGSIQKDLAESQHGWEKEKLRVMEAENEIQNLTRTYQKDTEENQTFFYSLYQRLLARGVLIQKPESMLDKFSWTELCLVLQENVDVLISDLNRANEKLSHLEYVCENKSEAMMELQKSHEDSLNKLAAEMKAQDRCWQKQRRDLEQHYSALLSEVQARAQKSSSTLKQQIFALTQRLHSAEVERRSLLSELSAMKGKLDKFEKNAESTERSKEQTQLFKSSQVVLYERYESTYEVLNNAVIRGQQAHSLLKVRSQKLTEVNLRIEMHSKNMQSDLREVNMELRHLRSKYADKESQIGSIQKDLAESQHGWEKEKLRVMEAENEIQNLTRTYQKYTENMQSDLREVNMELRHLRSKYADKESQIGSIQKDLAESQHGWEKEKLRVMEAENEIQNLTRTYQKYTENMQSDLREVNMELRHLRSKYADKESQIGSIQKDLAESQHGWEKEKLRVMEAENEIQNLTRTYQKYTEENQTFLHSLYQRLLARGVQIKQPESMLDKFSWTELCLVLQENVDVLISDLNRANEKLSHLEYVCKNKSDAMMELQKSHEDSLNKLAAEMKAQDRCWQKQRRDLEQHYSALLSEVQARAQGLSEAKQELRRKDQSLRQLTRQLSQLEQDKNWLEQEKNQLEESIHISESDLHMAAKDREFLANHMKSVEIVFKKVRDHISLSWSAPIRNDFTVHLPKLHSEIFAVEGHLGGSEFTVCQNMIRRFLDVYQLAWSKTTALEREIASHQKHIADLKSELQTACLGGNARLPTPVDYDRNSVLSARSESLLDKTTEPDFLPINAGTENHSSHMKYGYVASRSYSTRSSVFSLSTSPM